MLTTTNKKKKKSNRIVKKAYDFLEIIKQFF
jgi:hypothetical protein